MRISDLVYVGIRSRVVALNAANGERVWSVPLKRISFQSFVNLLLDGDRLYATSGGELFCLDALTGRLLWHNPLSGLGLGLVTLATAGKPHSDVTPLAAEKARRDAG